MRLISERMDLILCEEESPVGGKDWAQSAIRNARKHLRLARKSEGEKHLHHLHGYHASMAQAHLGMARDSAFGSEKNHRHETAAHKHRTKAAHIAADLDVKDPRWPRRKVAKEIMRRVRRVVSEPQIDISGEGDLDVDLETPE